MKIALDVMGFENDISEAINAAREFVKLHNDVQVILVGDKTKIQPLLKSEQEFEIHHADQIITMSDNPLFALRNKTGSSMYQSVKIVESGMADGVLSAGSTTCFVPITYYLLKLISGVNKPAFMPFIPTSTGVGFNMLDVGANKECTGVDLYQFAKMANVYVKSVRGIEKPRIGIVNIGTEVEKGFEYHKQAHELLTNDSNLNYVGFVEPRELLDGVVDIAVADGYTGNITLKALEGSMKSINKVLKQQFKKPWNWLGAILSINVFKKVKKTFDYKNNAGAFVMGLNKVVVKTHGSADKQQFLSSLRMLYETINHKVIEQIKKEIY